MYIHLYLINKSGSKTIMEFIRLVVKSLNYSFARNGHEFFDLFLFSSFPILSKQEEPLQFVISNIFNYELRTINPCAFLRFRINETFSNPWQLEVNETCNDSSSKTKT